MNRQIASYRKYNFLPINLRLPQLGAQWLGELPYFSRARGLPQSLLFVEVAIVHAGERSACRGHILPVQHGPGSAPAGE